MCKKIFSKKEKEIFNLIKNKIIKFNKIIILGHINPDGDSLGSQVGFKNLLKENFENKQILISGDYSNISNLDFLDYKVSNKKLKQKDFDESLVFLVDVQDIKRTEYSNFKFKNLIIIDHHKETKKHNCLVSWINEKYSAATQMIVDLGRSFNWKFNEKTATSLLTGTITDTGNFKYDSVNYETFENASFLIKKNANLKLIHENINKVTNNDIKVLNYIYKNIYNKNKLISLIFKPKDKEKLPFLKHHSQIRRFIGNFNFTNNSLVRVFFIQLNENDEIKCSIRGSSNFNVREIANKFGGGGHILASGIKLKNWKQVKDVLEEIKLKIKNYQKK